MEDEITYNINLSNERFISLLHNRIETNHNPYIINYIYNFHRDERYSNLYNLEPRASLSLLNIWSSVSHEEILLPAFVEQEIVIPEDAVCGITFEKPDCRSSCNHYFCCTAITTWFEQQKNECKKMTCPTCRNKISQVLVTKNK
jgi:hypothetical protein